MTDYLDILVNSARGSIEEGCYRTETGVNAPRLSLKNAILRCARAPIISEVKFASPSKGAIRGSRDLERVVDEMERGGAIGLSILTEPKHFKGDIEFIAKVRGRVKVPILMKDIILDRLQVESARKIGADAVLLIQTLFDRGYPKEPTQCMIDYAHSKGLEVLLEVHTDDEFRSALRTSADMIGINNRDLKTLQIDLGTTKRVLASHHAEGEVIVSESGVNIPEDIRYLRRCGAQAFLVGSAIMEADDVKEKVRTLVEAL